MPSFRSSVRRTSTFVFVTAAVFIPALAACSAEHAHAWQQHAEHVELERDTHHVRVLKENARLAVRSGDHGELGPHPDEGVAIRRTGDDWQFAQRAALLEIDGDTARFEVAFDGDANALLEITDHDNAIRIDVLPEQEGPWDIRVRFAGGQDPAFGMGDHGGYGSNFNIHGFNRDQLYQHQGGQMKRFVSTFTIFPQDRLAMVLFDRGIKSAAMIDRRTTMGVRDADELRGLWIFAGELDQIYAAYRDARHAHGYEDREPDRRFFYPGFESYGALAWRTNQQTVTDMLEQYLERDYPLQWAVVGSGFWMNPRGEPTGPEGLTTSFGIWGQRYPEPDQLKDFLQQNDLKLIMGLRHGFHALDEHGGEHETEVHGPWTEHALEHDYLLTDEQGQPRTFSVHFPRGTPVYLLDPDNDDAVRWFVEKAQLWGADGFKEDFMFRAGDNDYYDDNKLNPLLARMHDEGLMVMVRGAAYSVPGSILRINDTDISHNARDQDRILINALAYAASGQPNVYPDIVAGRPISNWSDRERNYLTRMAMASALMSSMSFGNPPWHMESEPHEQAALKAAQWHARYVPYIHSEALRSFKTGYPHTMTPLPIAYPDDEDTYNLASRDRKQYQWLVGDSLLATPPFGSDFADVQQRDVYLPQGRWMDYQTGEIFEGPTTLNDFDWPIDKIPAFVGGKGILVAQDDDGNLYAQLYPDVMDGRTYTYHHHEGGLHSRITVDAEHHRDTLSVEDADGQAIDLQQGHHERVLRFRLEPGQDYQVQQ